MAHLGGDCLVLCIASGNRTALCDTVAVLRVTEREPAVYRDAGPIDLVALLRPPPWHRDALCHEPAYAGLPWFPEVGDDLRAAKAVCGRCLVAPECLEAGIGEAAGIWGGASARQRRSKGPTTPQSAQRRSAAAGRARRAKAAQRRAA